MEVLKAVQLACSCSTKLQDGKFETKSDCSPVTSTQI